MNIQNYNVSELLPHGKTAILLDEVISYNDTSVACSLEIRKDSSFLENNNGKSFVPNYVGLEYMAQTIGIFSGIHLRKQGLPPKIGFIASIRGLDFFCYGFNLGQKIIINAYQQVITEMLGVFNCEIRSSENNNLLAQGRLSVFISEGVDMAKF